MEKQTNTPAKNPEDAATVGMFLKYTRLNQKKTLDAISKTLCIRKIYIKAIEDSDFKELPPVPYGIGFVRSYAEYLGLNSDRIVQCYKEEALPQKKETVSNKPPVSLHKIVSIPNRRQILIGIAAVVCLYLIWLLAFCKPENQNIATDDSTVSATAENNEPSSEFASLTEENGEQTIIEQIAGDKLLTPPETSPEQGTISVDTTSATDSQIKITDASYPVDSAEPVAETDSRIVVKFKGESWFEVRDDKKIYVTGVFEKGYVYNVPNQPGLRLSVGRYYNVDVYVDGKLTTVARPRKQTNIALDPFLNH